MNNLLFVVWLRTITFDNGCFLTSATIKLIFIVAFNGTINDIGFNLNSFF